MNMYHRENLLFIHMVPPGPYFITLLRNLAELSRGIYYSIHYRVTSRGAVYLYFCCLHTYVYFRLNLIIIYIIMCIIY